MEILAVHHHCESFSLSDADDVVLLGPCVHNSGGIANSEAILHIKHNDPRTSRISLNIARLNRRALKRLGIILRNNTSLEEIELISNQRRRFAELWPLVGLQTNDRLKHLAFNFVPLGGPVAGGPDVVSSLVKALATFLTDNPSLETLSLQNGFLGPPEIAFISRWLAARPSNTLVALDLSSNSIVEDGSFEGCHLDELVAAVRRNRRMRRLDLGGNQIGSAGVASLRALLADEDSNLEHLDLTCNLVKADDAVSLIEALVRNKKLKTLDLRANGWIRHDGWARILRRTLQLVCTGHALSNAADSNMTLSSLSFPFGDPHHEEHSEALPRPDEFDQGPNDRAYFDRALGGRDATLLRASFEANHGPGSDASKARKKVVMRHVLGDLDLGQEIAVAGTMPRVLSWIGRGEYNSRCPSLVLDAIFRVVRAKPDLCSRGRSL
ncbi:hypothetical protein ACHAWF_009824 [Thalassiosira exigua]